MALVQVASPGITLVIGGQREHSFSDCPPNSQLVTLVTLQTIHRGGPSGTRRGSSVCSRLTDHGDRERRPRSSRRLADAGPRDWDRGGLCHCLRFASLLASPKGETPRGRRPVRSGARPHRRWGVSAGCLRRVRPRVLVVVARKPTATTIAP